MIRLTDDQWKRIRDHFPEENIADGRPGRKPIPTRCVLEAVLWILDRAASQQPCFFAAVCTLALITRNMPSGTGGGPEILHFWGQKCGQRPVCVCRKLDSAILMMKTTEDRP
jgi:hypothetical protein